MEQRFLIIDNEGEVNDWLKKGWRVISVTPQHVSTGSTYASDKLRGKFAVVIQKVSTENENLHGLNS
jgi:hypothetical protein